MKILKRTELLLYFSLFLVTQITGLLLSLIVCFMLQDFIGGFIRIALTNSLFLGITLIATCHLTRRWMFVMKTLSIAAITFSLILGTAIISFLVLLYLEPTLFVYYYRGAISFLCINFLFITAVHVISSGLIISQETMVAKERTISNERDLRNQMELKLLASRLNPHFIFNTLNMIITLLKQPEKAESAILNLSDLLRENLEQSDKRSISIRQEIENAKKYLELQALRFGEKLCFTINGDIDFLVPPLIIQPLVENCIKHNIRNVSRLEIMITFSRNAGHNRITVIDSEKALTESMLNVGHGLTITKKRVENSNGQFRICDGGIEISFHQ